MSLPPISITLSEWETMSSTTSPELAKQHFDDSVGSQQIIETLYNKRMLQITELRKGIEVKSFSYVGRVQVGNLSITVLPKLKSTSLLRLLRYAFGFRRLKLISDSTQHVDQYGFEDLLISQLNTEVQELISRGLQRNYIRQDEQLASPRGRIDISRLALDGGTVTATLPCQHYPRVEDTLLNRVLMAGLHLAAKIANLIDLRRDSKRLASQMEEQVSSIKLDVAVMNQAVLQMNRLTIAYEPALSIIRLLVESQGIVFESNTLATASPGFMFNMNTFFQELLSRFLRENLTNHIVRDEQGLKGMMRYNPQFNPQHKQSPTPRPDFAIMQQGNLIALLDAKYRDLWEKPLPREMLYQLVVYAISHRQQPQSSILYPTINDRAKEARIDINDPLYGKHIGQVCLRPVDLNRIEELVSKDTAAIRKERERFALRLVFGE